MLAACFLGGPLHAEEIYVDSVLIRLIDQVDVPARVLGALVDIHVREGMSVTKGQLLAQIDDSDVKLGQQRAQFEDTLAQHLASDDVAIRSTQTAWEFSQAEYLRLLGAENARPASVSDSELEKSKHDADQAKLDMERARSELESTRLKAQLSATDLELARQSVEFRKIIAPMGGVVVSVLQRPGEWVEPGDKVVRIVRTDRLRAEGFVAASDVLRDLSQAQVTVEPIRKDGPRASFTGKIVFVSPEIDPVNGQVRVWAEVENPQGRLRPGLRAKMTIHAGSSQPRAAGARGH
jgi:RND family efflux transporter MFP subunit